MAGLMRHARDGPLVQEKSLGTRKPSYFLFFGMRPRLRLGAIFPRSSISRARTRVVKRDKNLVGCMPRHIERIRDSKRLIR